MYAEITFISTHNLPKNYVDKLKERIRTNCRLDEAIAKTDLNGTTIEIRLWQKNESYVFLMYEDDATRFKVHVENVPKGTVGDLKSHVKETMERFRETLKGFLYGELKCKVVIHAEGTTISVGKDTSRQEGLRLQLTKNWPTELYVPVASLLVSLLRRASAEESLANVGIVIIAMALWIVCETLCKYPSFEYEEA